MLAAFIDSKKLMADEAWQPRIVDLNKRLIDHEHGMRPIGAQVRVG